VFDELRTLSYDAKELTLFVTSSLTADHATLAKKLINDYDVIVEMNNAVGRDFQVRYKNRYREIGTWNIPFKYLNALADAGRLSKITKGENRVKTGINSKDDLTLPHILQSALFMGTKAVNRIQKNADPIEFLKLEKIHAALDPYRPDDYPKDPRIALIAGNLASRGITFQSPVIDFTCTSFCFTDTNDAASRGATNTQRFGRACGMLAEAFKRDGRKPILIATEAIVDAAVANEMAVMTKAKDIPNGELFCLKDMITKEEWKEIQALAKKKIEKAQEYVSKSEDDKSVSGDDMSDDEIVDGKIAGVDIVQLRNWIDDDNTKIIGQIIKYLYKQNNPVSLDNLNTGIKYEKALDQLKCHIRACYSKGSQFGYIVKAENYKNIKLNPIIASRIKKMLA
jgi:hypothetical protein